MAEPPRYPDTGDDTGVEPDRESITGPPRWVKASAIVVLVLVVLVAIMLLIGGNHGPGRHTASGGTGGHIAPANVAEQGEQQP